MVKKYAIIAIIALVGISAVSTAAFAEENDPSRINELKAILQQLQEKIKGFSQNGVMKKIENKVEKMGTIGKNMLPERIKVGKAGMNVEELGNGQIKVNIKNAVITAIDSANNTLTVKIFGLTGKIKMVANTKIQREYKGQSNINEFAVGDYVNAYGDQDKNDPTMINAEIVRNISLTKKDIEKREKVCIQIIAQAMDPQTNVCKQFPTPCAIPTGWVTCPTTSATSTTNITATSTTSTSTTQ